MIVFTVPLNAEQANNFVFANKTPNFMSSRSQEQRN